MEITSRKLRLFGVELDPETDKGSPESSHSSASSAVTGKPPAGKRSRGGGPLPETKKFECQCCLKVFANSYALGGHQNAHKKEGIRKKRLQVEARKPILSHKSNNNNSKCYNYYDSNSSYNLPEFYFKEEMYIRFGPDCPNFDLYGGEILGPYKELRDYCVSNQENIQKFSLTRVDRSRKKSKPPSSPGLNKNGDRID